MNEGKINPDSLWSRHGWTVHRGARQAFWYLLYFALIWLFVITPLVQWFQVGECVRGFVRSAFPFVGVAPALVWGGILRLNCPLCGKMYYLKPDRQAQSAFAPHCGNCGIPFGTQKKQTDDKRDD